MKKLTKIILIVCLVLALALGFGLGFGLKKTSNKKLTTQNTTANIKSTTSLNQKNNNVTTQPNFVLLQADIGEDIRENVYTNNITTTTNLSNQSNQPTDITTRTRNRFVLIEP